MNGLNMTDCDALADGSSVSGLAHALNVTMSNDASLRAEYLAMWGRAWMPLPTIGGESYFPDEDAMFSDDDVSFLVGRLSETTTAVTVR